LSAFSFKSSDVNSITVVGSTSSTSSKPKLSRFTNNKILVGLFSGSTPLLNSVNFIEWTYLLQYNMKYKG
jgi:hypothetical protein